MITVPEAFATATVAREGDTGRAWIAALPELVETLCQRWGLTVDSAPMHGYLGVVVPVTRGDETCVLKVSWIDESNRDEAIALSAWDGQGAVRLYEADVSLGAMVLERLEFTRTLNEVEIAEALYIAGQLHRRLAIPDPGGLRSVRTIG